MKKITFIATLIAALLLSVSFTSCGEDTNVTDIIDNVLHPVKTEVKKDGNKIIGTVSAINVFSYTATATFENDKCVSLTAKLDCKATFIVDAFEKVLKDGTREGNKITYDYSSEVQGLSFADVEKWINDKIGSVKNIADGIINK